MDLKALLKSFWQIINVFRIAGLHALCLYFISRSVGLIVMATGVSGCAPRPEFNNWYLWLNILFAIPFLIISLYYILHPSVWMQTVNRQLVFTPTNVNLPFFSTHPVYIFIDALFFVPAIALFQSGRAETMCEFKGEWAMGWALLILAFFYPVFRVFSWYVLNRRIQAMTIKPPILPIMWGYFIALPLIFFFTYTYMDTSVLPRLRVPVVNKLTFEGGLDNHPEFLDKVVRVQGILTRGIAKCGLFGKDPDEVPFPYGTVLLDLGKNNGQIMVQANRAHLVKNLELESLNKMGKVFEAFGRLSKLPNPDKRLICGIGKADSDQKGGLALLELEMP
ncbi:MAG: hypothetical protein KDB79_12700 [Acidobacteria bacterium]|nr:hypothetical protein [Acidobacteriota bacterium]